MYDDMSQDDWLEFSLHTKRLCEFRHLFEDEIDDVHDLNRLWDDTQRSIKEAAKTYIKSRQTITKKDGHPLRSSLLYQNIRFLQKLVIRLTNKKFLHNEHRTKLQNDWFCIKAKLFEIAGTYEVDINLDISLTEINLVANCKQIKMLSRSLMALFNIKMQEYNEEQIKNFVQKRCEDFTDNKKAMINSIAECEIRTIVLDQIVHETPAGTILVTDPNEIKKLTNDHFQLCPGAVNQDKPIPNQWKNQYEPLSYIDQDIYKNIMDPSYWDEWIQSVSELPNGKATSSSGISNEMIKYLSDEMQQVLFKIVCSCFKLQEIPSAWKLANVRLSNIFIQHKVLRGNQFAGLPHSSTFNPIRILNDIIQDAKEEKKNLWILSQDLFKAYDRVNIHILRKAMVRLHIPDNLFELVLSLFTNRKNSVFTPHGNTDPYNVLIGIDQGKVISPLLWCIYYDPLLCEVESRSLGYNLQATYKDNIYDLEHNIINQQISSMAYMDDTQWLSESKDNLEKILEIADDFYNFTDIQVNKQKSELLLRIQHSNFNYNDNIHLNFGNQQITIKPVHPSQSIRILGVWFNMNCSRRFIIDQIREEVHKLALCMKYKHLTDKQILYIYNSLIIPRVEYRSQITVLNKSESNSIIAPFRKIFKNKLHLALSIPNAILNNNFIYNFRDLYELQLQSKISNYNLQINSRGGNIEIRSLIPLFLFIKSLKLLKNRSIMFLEQITTLDGKSLINWKDLKFRSFSQSMALALIPYWFTYIKNISLLPDSHLLLPNLQTPSAHNFKGITITHPSFDNRVKGWTVFWVDRFNSSFFGKIIKKDTEKKKIYIQHFSPSRQNNLTFFDPCHGCILNNHQNSDCIIIIPRTDLILIPNNTITQITMRSRASLDLRDLFLQARFLYHFNRRLIPFYQDSIFIKRTDNIITKYIDFSDSHNGLESCSMSFGFAQACDNSPKVLFTSTCQHWPSSYRPESLAILTALIVAPINANVTIYTDSQSAIDTWSQFRSMNFDPHLRSIFKIRSNHIAHSGDPWNEFIDTKCSEVHVNNENSIITLLTNNMDNIHYTLKWNNIKIEQSPRKFITQTSKVRGFEEFFNLARNVKYRHTNVNWKLTFETLSGEELSNITTFKSSRLKAQKIKFLMEELPTIEQMKKSLLDIYDHWLCPV
ncbi:unnamed protein product [Rhizophagus irregularis]|nr:unnamed protein product [Rhizophagus irregularis]